LAHQQGVSEDGMAKRLILGGLVELKFTKPSDFSKLQLCKDAQYTLF
jgi:hypothetical protein